MVGHAADDGVGGEEVGGVEVEEFEVVHGGGEVGGGGESEAGFHHAADHAEAAGGVDDGGEFLAGADAAGFGEFEIDVVAGVVGEDAEGVVVVEDGFVGNNRDGGFGVDGFEVLEVPVGDGLLAVFDVEFVDAREDGQGGGDVPALVGVDADGGGWADGGADGADAGDVVFGVGAEFYFDDLEAAGDGGGGFFGHEFGRVDAEGEAGAEWAGGGAAEELVEGEIGGAGEDVVEGHVEGGADLGVVFEEAVEVCHAVFDGEGVLVDEEFGEVLGGGEVDGLGFAAEFPEGGGFAVAGEAGVGVDAEEDAHGGAHLHDGDAERVLEGDVGFEEVDGGDAHGEEFNEERRNMKD